MSIHFLKIIRNANFLKFGIRNAEFLKLGIRNAEFGIIVSAYADGFK